MSNERIKLKILKNNQELVCLKRNFRNEERRDLMEGALLRERRLLFFGVFKWCNKSRATP